MVKPTQYEGTLLSFLVRHFNEKLSINQVAKRIGMTPKGAHKLLKKLEGGGVVIPQRLANAVFYSVNFASDFARKKAELALFEDIALPYARAQAKDLERLRPFAAAAILFGSVLTRGDKAEDIDVLFVIGQHDYARFQQELDALQRLKPRRIHAVLQTPQDLIDNLKKPDKVVLDALAIGKVLWGHDIIVDAVRHAVQ